VRVLHVMEATIGGTRRHLRDVAAGQRAAGIDVAVAASALRMPEVRADFEALRAQGVHVHEIPMRREIRPADDWKHAKELGRLMRAWEPDIVHTHSSKGGALGRFASLRSGVGARVHTPHTFAFLFGAMFSGGKRRLFRAVETHLGRRTARIVAVGESEAQTIRASGVVPPERVVVVPNGIDPAPWVGAEPLARASLGVPASVPLAAVVGLLNVAKGQDVLLRALADPRAADLHLLVVGHGEDEPALRALARDLGLDDRVRFLGWRQDVPRLLATADFLVLPSRWEGLPYIVLEAMAAGLPIVATRVDGARELVDDGTSGFLAASEDPKDLARAIGAALVLDPAARSQMGLAGRARQRREYDLEGMVRRLDALYRGVLET